MRDAFVLQWGRVGTVRRKRSPLSKGQVIVLQAAAQAGGIARLKTNLRTGVFKSMVDRGLLTSEYEITDEGRAVAEGLPALREAAE